MKKAGARHIPAYFRVSSPGIVRLLFEPCSSPFPHPLHQRLTAIIACGQTILPRKLKMAGSSFLVHLADTLLGLKSRRFFGKAAYAALAPKGCVLSPKSLMFCEAF